MTFLVADGIVPSNDDRGYVLRRIIRRAVRYGYLLGVEGELSGRLVGAVVDAMADGYPELAADAGRITGIVAKEEDRFRQTRSEEHTSELQSLMRISYAVFCLKKKKTKT